jgi:hypothetical protein
MKRSAIIFAALISAGCAHFKPQPISPEKTAAQLESRPLDALEARLTTLLDATLFSNPCRLSKARICLSTV